MSWTELTLQHIGVFHEQTCRPASQSQIYQASPEYALCSLTAQHCLAATGVADIIRAAKFTQGPTIGTPL